MLGNLYFVHNIGIYFRLIKACS